MNIYCILTCWSVIISLIIGLYIFNADPKAKLNRLFLLISLCLSWWSFCFIFFYADPKGETGLFWYRMSALGWCIQVSITLHYIIELTKNQKLLKRKGIFVLIYLPALLIVFNEIVVLKRVKAYSMPVYNILMFIEYFYVFACFAFCIYFICRWYKNTKLLIEKKQGRIIIIYAAITFVMGVINQTAVYAFHSSTMPDMSNLILFIDVLAFWYVMVKYKLMDLKSLVSADDIVDKVTDIIILIDTNRKIININTVAEAILGYKNTELADRPVSVIIDKWEDNACGFDMNCITKDGRYIPVNIQCSSVIDAGGDTVGMVVICKDITLIKELQSELLLREQREKKLYYLSLHDPLTGIYNRRHFEEEMQRLDKGQCQSVGVVICDIDGLKVVNDTLGHDAGDKLLMDATGIIIEAFGNKSDIFRIGGDEFAILILDAKEADISEIDKKMNKAIERYNAENNIFSMSISMGYAISKNGVCNVFDALKEADNNMYRGKLNNIKSIRSSMVQALMKMLETRDFITEGHAERMKELVMALGAFMGLSEQKIKDLQLLAQFHDIGKIGIPDRILFKPSKLTDKEKAEMQLHSEIGFRLAESIPELLPIADLILKHHERWDGKGYPLGLKQADIALECRILSVVDAYDAMMNDRPYRKAMSQESAILELKENSGTQFDPQLVSKFIELLDKSPKPESNDKKKSKVKKIRRNIHNQNVSKEI